MATLQFAQNDIDAFVARSHDRSPIHTDIRYAQRVVSGELVVHGMCAVLKMIEKWLNGRSCSLKKLNVRFHKPIHLGVAYDFDFENKSSEVAMKLESGGVPILSLQLIEGKFSDTSGVSKPFTPLNEARERSLDQIPEFHDELPYSQGEKTDEGLSPLQATAICGASYLVGMEIVGKRALFLQANFDFENEPSSKSFCWENVAIRKDPRFGQITIEGKATGVRHFSLSALVREKELSFSIEEVRAVCGSGTDWLGKNVFITGSGRGFGSILAKSFALHGARVGIHYRLQEKEAKRTLDEINKERKGGFLVQSDLANAQEWSKACREIGEHFQSIDCLVLNAMPVIHFQKWQEQSVENFLGFIHRSLTFTLRPLKSLIQKVEEVNGHVLLVSSTFVERPEKGFSHYVSAKNAMEGLILALSVEYPRVRFHSYRAPRMLTDQSNSDWRRARYDSPITVAKRVMESISQPLLKVAS